MRKPPISRRIEHIIRSEGTEGSISLERLENLAAQAGINEHTFRQCLQELLSAGRVRKLSSKIIEITPRAKIDGPVRLVSAVSSSIQLFSASQDILPEGIFNDATIVKVIFGSVCAIVAAVGTRWK